MATTPTLQEQQEDQDQSQEQVTPKASQDPIADNKEMQAALVNAIHEQQAEISALQLEVKELKAAK